MASPAFKKRHEGCCSIDFLRYVLFIFNFFFLMAGLAVLGFGLWTVIDKHQYVSLLSSGTYVAIAYLLIAAGISAIIVSIIGCVGIWREDRCALLVYTILLVLIFLMEATAGLLAYVYEDQVEKELGEDLKETFNLNYMFEESLTREIDSIQREYKCCGGVSFEDWKFSQWKRQNPKLNNSVPDSCCKTESKFCGISDHPSNIYYDGCAQPLSRKMQDHLIILGAVGLGISLVQIVGLIFSCCLYVKLRDIEELY